MRMVWRLLRRTATRPWNYCANCYSETTLLNYTDSQILIKNKQTNNRRLLRHNQALIASFTGENDSFSYYLSLVFRSSLVFSVHSNLENDKYLKGFQSVNLERTVKLLMQVDYTTSCHTPPDWDLSTSMHITTLRNPYVQSVRSLCPRKGNLHFETSKFQVIDSALIQGKPAPVSGRDSRGVFLQNNEHKPNQPHIHI